ncbi:putative monooxygenase [Kibdelosporangium banguiense]|uniref:Monooxygenase n=1 Tax=Kibdelosporangium banguiense TaxID=1365924 RepID=A0ABS4TG66_9PSEU|nr:cupin domain-containing protein [Kibdelosporangium banguiense]MBP2323418.1 putative monooxygenase [Kibdelosporangium banguiense]
MTTNVRRVIGIDDVPAVTTRGGDIRLLLTPGTVGASTGFLGVAILKPGERITEHYHPYSDEFLYVVSGDVTLDLDDEPITMCTGQGVLVPRYVRHRVRNAGDVEVRVVFHLCPLAPRLDLSHVYTEEIP